MIKGISIPNGPKHWWKKMIQKSIVFNLASNNPKRYVQPLRSILIAFPFSQNAFRANHQKQNSFDSSEEISLNSKKVAWMRTAIGANGSMLTGAFSYALVPWDESHCMWSQFI